MVGTAGWRRNFNWGASAAFAHPTTAEDDSPGAPRRPLDQAAILAQDRIVFRIVFDRQEWPVP
jgi:hypothetical protein